MLVQSCRDAQNDSAFECNERSAALHRFRVL
jgi:hypothetical protein